MNSGIVIVDFGMGNLFSIQKKLKKINASCSVSSDPELIANADKIILPGVGHFSKAMENLKKMNLSEVISDFVLTRKRPVLGICLGMQIFAKHSEEGNCEGLGWIDMNVIKFRIEEPIKFKIPHMGWNTVFLANNSILMKNITETDEFYFVHSFHLTGNESKEVINTTNYSYNFCSAIQKDNIFGVQYHPEKSHDAGETIFKNFVKL